MEGLLAGAEDNVKQIPNFQLAQTIYEYRLSPSTELKEKIVQYIRDDSMEKYYAGTHSCLLTCSYSLVFTHSFTYAHSHTYLFFYSMQLCALNLNGN